MFDSAIRFRGFEHPYGRLLSYKQNQTMLEHNSSSTTVREALCTAYNVREEQLYKVEGTVTNVYSADRRLWDDIVSPKITCLNGAPEEQLMRIILCLY